MAPAPRWSAGGQSGQDRETDEERCQREQCSHPAADALDRDARLHHQLARKPLRGIEWSEHAAQPGSGQTAKVTLVGDRPAHSPNVRHGYDRSGSTPAAVFGFLGPNGAGKTTTIRLLMALLRADAGAARIAGLDCWRETLAIKRLVGYAPGEPSLDAELTGGQTLEYLAHLRGGVDQAFLEQLIDRLDLDPTHKFRQYSSGNKRKVALIQAFMHRPRLMILDEPTSGLDPLNQHEFGRMVDEVRGDGRTVFVSSHILSEVEQWCTWVGIIREGRIVRVGGVAEVKDSDQPRAEPGGHLPALLRGGRSGSQGAYQCGLGAST